MCYLLKSENWKRSTSSETSSDVDLTVVGGTDLKPWWPHLLSQYGVTWPALSVSALATLSTFYALCHYLLGKIQLVVLWANSPGFASRSLFQLGTSQLTSDKLSPPQAASCPPLNHGHIQLSCEPASLRTEAFHSQGPASGNNGSRANKNCLWNAPQQPEEVSVSSPEHCSALMFSQVSRTLDHMPSGLWSE